MKIVINNKPSRWQTGALSLLAMAAMSVSGSATAQTCNTGGVICQDSDLMAVAGVEEPGFRSAQRYNPNNNKLAVILVGANYNPNRDHPSTRFDQFSHFMNAIPLDWNIAIYDYIDHAIDINHNSDNLAAYLEFQRSVAEAHHPNGLERLALVGFSMGGIIGRNMFVRQDDNLGVDTFVTVDSPHRGIVASNWLLGLQYFAAEFANFDSGKQMLYGTGMHHQLYGTMRASENNASWYNRVIEPIDTLAIALSNGENRWDIWPNHLVFNTIYHKVCSNFSIPPIINVDWIPYHSSMNFDNAGFTARNYFFFTRFNYNNTRTSYFDRKRANAQSGHGQPDYTQRQAAGFVLHGDPDYVF